MYDKYELVAGLEIHARLKTQTKLFCSCSNDTFSKEANSLICPICAGFPGALPVLNKEALSMAIKTGLALKCDVKKFSKFDRKSYFYPDLPSGFQISQYDEPICEGGELEVYVGEEKKTFQFNRIHMENDAGKLTHENHSSLVDLNRAGSPLIEMVTEPCFRSSEDVFEFLKELQRTLRFLGTSDADMEKGMMRCDANISIRLKGAVEFGTKVEIKNMNSFNNIKKALDYEFVRQVKAVEKGEKLIQETRGWVDDKEITVSQRSKEESADYRYFPEPDLPPVILDNAELDAYKKEVPELSAQKRTRFINDFKLPFKHASTLSWERELAEFFEEVVKISNNPQKAANLILGDYLALQKEQEVNISAANLAKIIKLMDEGKISSKIAKEILPEISKSDLDPEKYVEEKGLIQMSDTGELETVCQEVMSENPKMVEDFKGGKEKAIGGLVGQVMKKTQGKASPPMVNDILRKLMS
ncbi:MAG: Asp-tRNA(Asn)/Glu-tRNA(Gln) amidotransferase subunit GatB [Candidatus Gracilibacteria bacterium]|jgi:aspartyl-tRNA(Asn)/glutamyl-tRNA(Gln) amidotransferase subunit B|nr:Asp-tRNA(Asn)/Glu-tRNA(Gln) amidotransferase subunit GatB [Candidatus Gracilibacteria bacterium]